MLMESASVAFGVCCDCHWYVCLPIYWIVHS